MRRFVMLAAAVVACSPSTPSFSKTPEAMNAWARQELQSQLAAWTIEADADPLVLRLKRGDQNLEVWLGRPFEYCQNNGKDCERMAREYLDAVVQAARQSAASKAPEASQLLPAIRSRAEVESYRSRAKGLVEEPIAGDLFLVYMIDAPQSASVVDGETVQALHLSSEQVKSRAFENLRAQVPALSSLVRPPGSESIGAIQLENYYTSSLLLPHSAWSAVADSFDGKLLVAVPAPDTLLYAEDKGAGSVQALSEKAKEAFTRSPRGTSLSVLRWSPSGWVAAEEP